MSDIDEDTKTMTFSKEALRVIDDMNYHCNNLAQWYGPESPQFIKASNSLRHVLVQMLGLGGSITKDGPLSLYSVSFIHYGVIWHGNRDADMFRGNPSVGCPETGEWSIHS